MKIRGSEETSYIIIIFTKYVNNLNLSSLNLAAPSSVKLQYRNFSLFPAPQTGAPSSRNLPTFPPLRFGSNERPVICLTTVRI